MSSENPPDDLLTSPSPPPSSSSTPIPDANPSTPSPPDLPLTMSASIVLADLPRDASAALASAGTFAQDKVVVKFKPVGAPALAQDVCKISAERRFEEVVRYLRRKLKCKDEESVFLYVNSAFAPSLDEVVGNLYQVRSNHAYTAYSDYHDGQGEIDNANLYSVLQEHNRPTSSFLFHHPSIWMMLDEFLVSYSSTLMEMLNENKGFAVSSPTKTPTRC